MEESHWKEGFAKSLGIFLNGSGLNTVDENNEAVVDDSFYILFNAHSGPLEFKLPEEKYGATWKKVWDTGDPKAENGKEYAAGDAAMTGDRTIVLLQSPLKQGKS